RGIPGGIPRSWGIPPVGEFSMSLCRAADAALGLRVNLPGGKFWVDIGYLGFAYFCLAAKFLSFGLFGRWRGLFLVLRGLMFGALVRSWFDSISGGGLSCLLA
ncbi:hypothetical protein, partial [Streptomyces achromogenes]|uniref:hypothetical protein n=1 Tax=Streptomyces achromogenes TaxID=67255 RepID=UPI0038650374